MTFDQIEGDKLPSDHPMHNTNNLWAPREEPDHSDRMPGVAGSNYVSSISPRGLTKSKSRAVRAGELHDRNHQHSMSGSMDQNFSASSFKGYLNEHQNINLAGAEGPDHTVLPVKSNTLTPSATFTRLRPPIPSPKGRRGIRDGFTKEATLRWLRKPMNLLLLAWLILTIIVGIIWLMITFGMLNSAIPNKRERDDIYEICNQILNALFVLRALCLQPVKTLHLFWVVRWRVTPKDDIARLRAVYCKDGLRKPYERVHILIILQLLQLSYLTSYVMAALCWAYKRSVRPELWVNVMFGLTLGSSLTARFYHKYSPLGRDYVLDDGQDSAIAVTQKSHADLPR